MGFCLSKHVINPALLYQTTDCFTVWGSSTFLHWLCNFKHSVMLELQTAVEGGFMKNAKLNDMLKYTAKIISYFMIQRNPKREKEIEGVRTLEFIFNWKWLVKFAMVLACLRGLFSSGPPTNIFSIQNIVHSSDTCITYSWRISLAGLRFCAELYLLCVEMEK